MRMLVWLSVVAVCWSLPWTAAAASPALPWMLEVESPSGARLEAPVRFALPPGAALPAAWRIVEVTGDGERPAPAQLDPDGRTVWWIAVGPTPAGQVRRFRLEAGEPSAPAAALSLVEGERALEIRHRDRPLVRYNKAHVEPPAGVNPRYGRSAHLHPVWTPGGAVVTDEFPPDHLHQSGIFLAYTKTQFAGHAVDFWNLAGGQGRVRFKSQVRLATGPVFSRFVVEHEHVDLTAVPNEPPATAPGRVALVEQWEVTVWAAGLAAGHYALDIASRAACATDEPLHLPEYHYGGMALRGAREWTPAHVRFVTSEGLERVPGNHTRPRWCNVSGAVGGKPAGLVLMTHPSNFRFPEPLRIHPTMPYMVYTPSFLGDWAIRPGQPHAARYRFLVHDGDLPAEQIERLWQDFAQPPAATMRP